MKKLDESKLLVGDIILTTGNTILSKSIRTITASSISHAMLYVTVCSVIHADGLGVRAENTQRMLFEDDSIVYGLRLKQELPPADAREICNYARQVIATEYSVKEVLKSASPIKTASVKQFCSRLVAQAYNKQGYKIVRNPDFCSPGALLRSKLLQQIPDITRSVSAAEAVLIETIPNIPDQLTAATNKLFAQVRSIDPSVQTFSDLGRLVITHKDVDILIRNIIIKSGYLDFYNVDETQHPWRYNIELMKTMPESLELTRYCKDTMKGDSRDDNRFTVTLHNLIKDNARNPRLTLQVLIDLHRHLAKMHALRVDTAEEWLLSRTTQA